MVHLSTFLIVAYDPGETAWGIAVASKFLAVGSMVPWARANAGAIATQSYANPAYGPLGLDLLQAGLTAHEALQKLLAEDDERTSRQVGLVDTQGNAATYTGKACHAWAGGLTGNGYAIQGNILTGAEVIQAMESAFIHIVGNLPMRLHAALMAGDRAGGDRRGRQSAAILVVKPQGGYGGFNDRWVDYRVDDHNDPVTRLSELLKLHDLYFSKSPLEDQISLTGEKLIKLQMIMKRLGYYSGPQHGVYDPATRTALETFIGNENFEERTDFKNGRIDGPVYTYLLERFSEAE